MPKAKRGESKLGNLVGSGLLLVLLSGVGVLTGGCSERCDLGDDRSCVAEDGCIGTQSCDDGSGQWSTCSCEEAGSQALELSAPGRTCARSADCGQDEVCLTSDGEHYLGGGVAGGFCTLDCTAGDSICQRYSARAQCVQTAGQDTEAMTDDLFYCLQGCATGDGNASKCGERSNLACDNSFEREGGSQAVCRPLCLTDAECGDGYCNPGTGACVAEKPKGASFGQACEVEADCAGICTQAGTRDDASFAFCSQRCVLGSGVCAASQGGEALGYCFLLASPGNNSGDTGFCEPLCDCPQDCAHPDAVCTASAEVERKTGRKGTCTAAGVPGEVVRCSSCVEGGMSVDAGLDSGANGGTSNPGRTTADAGGGESSVADVEDAASAVLPTRDAAVLEIAVLPDAGGAEEPVASMSSPDAAGLPAVDAQAD